MQCNRKTTTDSLCHKRVLKRLLKQFYFPMRENMLGITDSPDPSVWWGKLYCIGVENISDAPRQYEFLLVYCNCLN